MDGKVKDAVYLWAIATFKGQTASNHQLVLDAVEKGIKFFKYYKKTKTYAADLRLHCSVRAGTHGPHPIEFFYVKHIHFVSETESVEIQMNGGCMAINDASRLVTNPINNEKVCSIFFLLFLLFKLLTF